MGASSSRVPSLDGLRAISIVFVFVAHLSRGVTDPSVRRMAELLDWGNVGVRVFFVISGYLISTLLFRELEKTSTISLKNF